MQHGLEGRRIALYVGSLSNGGGAGIQQALEAAGARVHVLADDAQPDDFRGGVYAGLVAVSGARENADSRVVQLVREFMASDKPVAVFGDGVNLLLQAGGAAGRKIACDDSHRAELEGAGATADASPVLVDEALITAQESADPAEFGRTVVREFSERLDDRAVDEMSDLSFPASDPPAVSPSSLGTSGSPDARP